MFVLVVGGGKVGYYLAKEPAAKDGFDEQVVQALRDRAAAAGVRF